MRWIAIPFLFIVFICLVSCSSPKKEKGPETKETASEKKEVKKAVMLRLEPVIVNLGGEETLLKITLELELSSPAIEEEIKKNKFIIKDMLITVLSHKTYASVRTPRGKILLKDEIHMRLEQILGQDTVTEVLLAEFAVQ